MPSATYVAAAGRVNYRTVGGTIETRRRGETIDNIAGDAVDGKLESGAIVTEDEWAGTEEQVRQARVAEQQPAARPTLESQSETPPAQVELDVATVASKSVADLKRLAGGDVNRRRQIAALEAQRPEDQQRSSVLDLAG